MVDFKTSEYGEDFLKKFGDVTKYDYRNKTIEENPLGHKGIRILTWDGQYNNYLIYTDNGVTFRIEDSLSTYLNKLILYEDLTISHFEYFSDYITFLREHSKKCSEFKVNFGKILPQTYIRNEKLNQLI